MSNYYSKVKHLKYASLEQVTRYKKMKKNSLGYILNKIFKATIIIIVVILLIQKLNELLNKDQIILVKESEIVTVPNKKKGPAAFKTGPHLQGEKDERL